MSTSKPTDHLGQALARRTVVITRAQGQADEFVKELEQYGARVIVCPMIEITDPENYQRLDEAIDHLYGYDWLIFTSVNGVEYFFRRLAVRKHEASELDEFHVCAIGEATAEKLNDLHVHVDLVPEVFKAEGIFEALQRFLGGRAALEGLNFLVPRAAVARDFLPQALESAGARVDVVPAYRTVIPADVDRHRLGTLVAGGADCIAFTSSSTVRNLAQLFDTRDLSELLSGVTVACIGEVTARTASEFGLTVTIEPAQYTIPALASAIAAFYGQNNARGNL
ncbi:MAG TPA: uroporphyrinogen-III synthase [Pyrinomonadaceae bacterium]|nr:uroporphyrinogen-III synthase [Pyrinomonadaceae bacterium]